MEANELRIGNLIQLFRRPSDMKKTPHKVRSIFWHDDGYYCIELDDLFIVNTLAGIEPIDLTEEWLLKLGFTKSISPDGDDNYHIMNKDGFSTDFTVEHWTNTQKHSKYHNHFHIYGARRNIKYVHELQNLYYALTGKELNI